MFSLKFSVGRFFGGVKTQEQMVKDTVAEQRAIEQAYEGYDNPYETQQICTECAPKCPKCGAEMVTRTNKRLQITFWGCSEFPNCDGNRDY
jgi:ssDNA-binding Zn-finger/Zn-ribbon topoisomerase 1